MGDGYYSTRQTLYTAATVEPVSVQECRVQCRITDTSEDDLLGTFVTAAREHVENVTGRKLVNQTWDCYFEVLDEPLVLPFAPLSSVTSLKYQDTANAQQTLAATYYETAERDGRPIIRLKYDQSYPSTLGHGDDVVVRAVFGYGASGASVPGPLKQLIKWMVGHLYENREFVSIGNTVTDIPNTVQTLLLPYRVVEFR